MICCRLWLTDHPRSRGVYPLPLLEYQSIWGSSPLARGLLLRFRRQIKISRIIPARAGFTQSSLRKASAHSGSSPLARGLRARRAVVERRARIIPARAGFTLRILGRSFRARDHPRSRGVYGNPLSRACARWGSSPLARGLLVYVCSMWDKAGIIPARAGFTAAE